MKEFVNPSHIAFDHEGICKYILFKLAFDHEGFCKSIPFKLAFDREGICNSIQYEIAFDHEGICKSIPYEIAFDCEGIWKSILYRICEGICKFIPYKIAFDREGICQRNFYSKVGILDLYSIPSQSQTTILSFAPSHSQTILSLVFFQDHFIASQSYTFSFQHPHFCISA